MRLSCISVAIPFDWVILHWYACGADGRSLGVRSRDRLPNFLRWVDYFIFSPEVLRWRASRARAPLLCFYYVSEDMLCLLRDAIICYCYEGNKVISFATITVNGDCHRLNRNREIGISQWGVHQLICRYSVSVFSTISTDFVYCIQLTGRHLMGCLLAGRGIFRL